MGKPSRADDFSRSLVPFFLNNVPKNRKKHGFICIFVLMSFSASIKMKQSITIFFLLVCTTIMVAQADALKKKNSFQLSFGLNQIKEKTIHPKVHSGTSLLLKYTRKKEKKNRSRYNVSFLFSKIKTKYENATRSTNIQLKGDYGYLFNLKKTGKYQFFLGPSLSANYRLSFYPNWDESHLYWADDFSLELSNQFQYFINDKKTLVLDLNISAFSLFSRPELHRNHKIDDVSAGGIIKSMHSNYQFGTVNQAINICFQSEYQFKISDKIHQAIVYTFDYSRFKEPLPFRNMQHNLSFKIYF